MTSVIDLGDRISMIDLYDVQLPERTGGYVLHEESIALIETSASPSIPYLLKGLDQLDINPEDIKYIIVTHIHLDHAGGAGLLLEHCPNAKVVVHPRGYRHLADPSRLIQGARAVYQEAFDELFDPIKPIPEDRLIVMEDEEQLKLSDDRVLTFYDTPGHAKHHFSIHDSLSNGMFTGDTIGVRYAQLAEHFEFVLPSTSPNQFDPDAMLDSMERIKSLNVSRIFFGHYGASESPEDVYRQLRYYLSLFMERAYKVYETGESLSDEEKSRVLADQLIETVQAHLKEQMINEDHFVYRYLELDLQICAQGIIDYLNKQVKRER